MAATTRYLLVGAALAALVSSDAIAQPVVAAAATEFKAMDTNGDGKVTREEYLNYYGKRYDSYDTTKRGYYDRTSARTLYLEREMSKTDGQPKGDPLNSTTKK